MIAYLSNFTPNLYFPRTTLFYLSLLIPCSFYKPYICKWSELAIQSRFEDTNQTKRILGPRLLSLICHPILSLIYTNKGKVRKEISFLHIIN